MLRLLEEDEEDLRVGGGGEGLSRGGGLDRTCGCAEEEVRGGRAMDGETDILLSRGRGPRRRET